VIIVAKTLKSKGFLEETYNWNWHYYHLTSAGVKYLVSALGKCILCQASQLILFQLHSSQARELLPKPKPEKKVKRRLADMRLMLKETSQLHHSAEERDDF
jgi:hypothetical protein